jgi:putative oxidoreductase
MQLTTLYQRFLQTVQAPVCRDVTLFFVRLALAYGFYVPASAKWGDIRAIGEWFGELGIPAPYFNAYMAATTEALGIGVLLLGIGTRLFTFPLIVVMLVAIKTVHLENGFDAGNNGFEIPLYYILLLLLLLVNGAGRLSARKWAGQYQV